MNPTTITSDPNSCVSDSDQINESSYLPYTKTVRIDDSAAIHKPLAVRRASQKTRIPRRFTDLLPSAQVAATLSNVAQT
jgi:hypothetical protein